MKDLGTILRINDIDQALSEFNKIKELGFNTCHLVYKPKVYLASDAEKLKQASVCSGVKIVAFFAGYNDNFTKWDIYGDYKIAGINSKKYGRARIRYIKKASAFAKLIGVKKILIHAGFVSNNPFSSEYKHTKKVIGSFAKYLKQLDLELLLETGGESPVTMLRLIEEINLGNIYTNLDTANLIMYGYGNPKDAVVTLKDYIKSVHVKDGTPPTTYTNIGKETKVGYGSVDFIGVFEQLKKNDFDGDVIIEREITGKEKQQDLVDTIKYLREHIKI